jgi:hypothetical protein
MPTTTSIGTFARTYLKQPLYPYQELIANAILDSILRQRGLTFTVMLARQMGKNQLSAVLEAYLLCFKQSGTIVKAAPTFRPQIINSRARLLSMLNNPLTRERIWKAYGYMIGVAPDAQQRDTQSGPRVMFFSASPTSSIVGATASLLLEVDEAQDVTVDKFDRDLRPMGSTTNTTTILYGTAWADDTLLATMKTINQQLEERDGVRRHFEYDWTTLAALNPAYRRYVENEMQRLGEDNINILTQYRLLPINGAGHFLNALEHQLLQGHHDWLYAPDERDNENNEAACLYVAGMDVGGEDHAHHTIGEELVHQSGRDSTVISIGRVSYNKERLPQIEIIHQVWWTGKPYDEQYAAALAICERWGVSKLVTDRTGIGDFMASQLQKSMGTRLIPFHFSRSSKSALTFQFKGMIDSGRFRLYRPDNAPLATSEECWKQLKRARYRIPGEQLIDMFVPPAEGHDDFLISLALCCEAIKSWTMPVSEAHIVRPRIYYTKEGRY